MPNGIALNQSFPNIAQSDAWYARAQGLIPCITQVMAKGPQQYTNGVAPKYAERAQGAHLWDVDGNQYLDYTMGVGPVSLGYAYPAVDEAIKAQLGKGITFSIIDPLEVEVSEKLKAFIPNAERVRFSKTGCDVTSAAIRLARAHTGRERVLCCGYHGWHDWYIATTPRNAGIPQAVKELTTPFIYNNLADLKTKLNNEVAAVILEPMVFHYPDEGFLQGVVDAAHAAGALVIFDEMWTGFRLGLGGAQQYFGITPDLATYSKAIANGMPLSALTGKAEVMDTLERDDVFFFTTFGGEALTLAAAKATLEVMEAEDVPAHLLHMGQQLQEGYNQLANELGTPYTQCIGHPARTMVTFAPEAGDGLELKTLMQQELIRHGVLWSGFHNLSFSHTQADVDHTLAAYREVLPLLKAAVEAGDVRHRLKGEVLQPVFRKTV